ncbi:MAG: ABC transporter permease [Planctomycetota bacterium]
MLTAKAWTVGWNEYLRSVRTKAFLVGVLVMPLLMGAGLIVAIVAKETKDVADQHYVVIDRTGAMTPVLDAAAEARHRDGIWKGKPDADGQREQIAPRFVREELALSAGDPLDLEQELTLAQRVRDKELLGYLVINPEALSEVPEPGALAWHTASPTNNDLPDWLEATLHEELRQQRFQRAGLDAALVSRLSARLELETRGLPSRAAGGTVKAAEASNDVADVAIPIGLMFMIYMLIFMSAPAMLNAVLEEKMQKIAEVLVSAVSPSDLMAGKLIAAVLTSFTLAVIYLGAGVTALNLWPDVPPVITAALGPGILAIFFAFLLLGLIIFGSICTALGAACSELQDAQSLMGPVILVCMAPMFFFGVVLDSPDSTLSRIVSFIPTATPILMMLRVAMPPGVPWWELTAAIAVMLTFSVFCIFAGGRIFRIGLLAQGQTPKFRQLLRWVKDG